MAKFVFSAFADEADASIAGQIRALQQNKIHFVETRGINGKPSIQLTDAEYAEVKKQLDEAGIRVSSIGSPIGKYPIEEPFEIHLEDFKKALHAAKMLGTDKIRMFSFYVSEDKYDVYRDEVIRRLSVMLEMAKAEGITLCHENEALIYGQNVDRVRDLLESLPEMKGIFDAANFLMTDNDPIQGIDATLPSLEYVHIKDGLSFEKMILPAGEGEGHLAEALQKIDAAYPDKTIYLSIEPHLADFIGYKDIDGRALKSKYQFADSFEKFACAVKALEKVMKKAGFACDDDGVWTKRELAPVRYGIIGMGNQGKLYAKLLQEGGVRHGVLAAMCDRDPAVLQLAKETNGDKFAYFADAETMMRSGKIDAVLIEVPHYQHTDLAILAMDCGLHAIVDKPAGVYAEQVTEMLKRNQSNDKILAIMFNQRTNPAFRKMRQMIADGELGEIKRTNWIITDWYRTQQYYDSGNWRGTWDGEGGGVLYNQAPHQLDLFQWIVGMMPTKMHAFCHFGKWHNIEVEDDVTAYCEYANGATGTFITTTADTPGTNRFEVTGSKGTLVFENNTLTFTELEEDERSYCFTAKDGFTPPKSTKKQVNFYGENSQHTGVLNNVSNAILGLEELFSPAEDGICGVEIANAMHASAWRQETVTVPVNEKKFRKELEKTIKKSLANKKK